MTPSTLSISAVLVIVLAIAPMLAHHLDQPDRRHEVPEAISQEQAMRDVAQALAVEAVADAVCQKQEGPNSMAVEVNGIFKCAAGRSFKELKL